VEHLFTVSENDSGTRADVFLAERSTFSRSRIKKLMDDGCAVSSDGSPIKPSYPVEPGDTILLRVPERKEPVFKPENIPLDIVFKDDHIMVVNKPPGMVVHPGRGNVTGTLASALLYHCKTLSTVGGSFRPGIVHRLDKDTSGLIVAALDDTVHAKLSRMLSEHKIQRVYTAFVWGHPDPESGTIEAPVGRHPTKPTLKAVVEDGRQAVTHYETLRRYEFLTKLDVTLETGRTHQIRVHLAHIGHHVFGDPIYGGREELLKGFNPDVRLTARHLLENLDRQALHAGQLGFRHPVTDEELSFEVPMPGDMERLEAGNRD